MHSIEKQLNFLKKSLTINSEVLFSQEKGLKTLVIHFHGVFKAKLLIGILFCTGIIYMFNK
ncbi:hypothetical protein FPV32_06595 [Bacillus tequilensis]|nr:hypothetical protein [Bacillus tequilensis]